MTLPIKQVTDKWRIVLASTSAQRKKLLQQIGLNFSVHPSPFDEESVSKTSFDETSGYVKHVASRKAVEVARLYANDANVLVIGADTVIVLDEEIIGKPHTPDVASATLQKLSGRSHQVITGVCVVTDMREHYFEVRTTVRFGELNDATIAGYVATGEPLNKAGAYGIQGVGAVLVAAIDGDYNNVVGFPLYEFCSRLPSILST